MQTTVINNVQHCLKVFAAFRIVYIKNLCIKNCMAQNISSKAAVLRVDEENPVKEMKEKSYTCVFDYDLPVAKVGAQLDYKWISRPN